MTEDQCDRCAHSCTGWVRVGDCPCFEPKVETYIVDATLVLNMEATSAEMARAIAEGVVSEIEQCMRRHVDSRTRLVDVEYTEHGVLPDDDYGYEEEEE